MHKVDLKSLYFNLAYVFLFTPEYRFYINKTHPHAYTQSGAEKSLFQFCLTFTTPFSPFGLEEMKNY